MATKPTIETILERINEFSLQLKGVETKFSDEFRKVHERLDKFDRKIDVLNRDVLEVRADMRHMEKVLETVQHDLNGLVPTRTLS
ncbi:MAG: hypothetical protein K1Y36_28435 [Blastocatellia bacterium]|nr:hypothetical protein [Blastocatellia bacterium]